jgi:hypothetical protein
VREGVTVCQLHRSCGLSRRHAQCANGVQPSSQSPMRWIQLRCHGSYHNEDSNGCRLLICSAVLLILLAKARAQLHGSAEIFVVSLRIHFKEHSSVLSLLDSFASPRSLTPTLLTRTRHRCESTEVLVSNLFQNPRTKFWEYVAWNNQRVRFISPFF